MKEIRKRKKKKKKEDGNKQRGVWVDKKRGKKKKGKVRKGEETNRREGERGKKGGFLLSLRSTWIGPSVFVGARGKVDPHNGGYAWVPKSRSLVKLQEVGNFPTWIISSLKANK